MITRAHGSSIGCWRKRARRTYNERELEMVSLLVRKTGQVVQILGLSALLDHHQRHRAVTEMRMRRHAIGRLCG
jgi:hypothetical protein